MAVATTSVAQVCAAARTAAADLAALPTDTKNAALHAIADALIVNTAEILAANAGDLEDGRAAGLTDALIDRLTLTPERIASVAQQTRDVATLPDPVGEVVEGGRLANGIELRRERVPFGVVAVVYEARPNVTIDAAALCIKSGNACVLRGSSSAARTNAVLATIAAGAAASAGVPEGAIGLVAGGGREELAELATQDGVVDLIFPRGGAGLKAALQGVATVPVIYAAAGICHIYVDAAADLTAAHDIVLNAKVQRPGVCNAAETLLVHEDVAPAFLPHVLTALDAAGVELRVDERTRALAPADLAGKLVDATDADWDEEYLALILSVRVVDDADAAIAHINAHGSGHSEAILTADVPTARAFTRRVDAAVVYVNASTRFTDGAEFGKGAEIGISTQKLHARGPIGLRELCTTKYVAWGDGHVRG
ncbi:MAG: glutamate-5-semialdehyde dehydrogenase [Solirubrobacteraceae bacterium]|nr:glutamate-5-semialdehyde dehydrogenase [Solirubrobacteraceae bacterium]